MKNIKDLISDGFEFVAGLVLLVIAIGFWLGFIVWLVGIIL